VPDLSMATWAWLLVAGGLVGFAKTAIGGVGPLAVGIFAMVLPARESTGALLPLLICGDVLAVAVYRSHASWPLLLKLLPAVFPGLLAGALFVAVVDDTWMRRSIAAILAVMIAAQVCLRGRRAPRSAGGRADGAAGAPHWLLTALVGALAGFATMTANAAGPVMTLYLILAGHSVLALLGTAAWFFLVVNLAKLPFSAGLSLISADSLLVDAALVPALVGGAALGVAVVKRIDRRQFELAALGLSGVAAALLVV
jgi:uncharacterized membrane protein YfcA